MSAELSDAALHRREFRAVLARRVAVLAGLILLAAVLVVQLYTVIEIRHQQFSALKTIDSTHQSAADSRHALNIIIDCTIPAGKCFQRGQEQTKKAVASIGVTSLANNFCASRPANDTPLKVLACVRRVYPLLSKEMTR